MHKHNTINNKQQKKKVKLKISLYSHLLKMLIYYCVNIMNHYILWINCTTCHLTWLIYKIKNNTTLSEQLQNQIEQS